MRKETSDKCYWSINYKRKRIIIIERTRRRRLKTAESF
jgi:hypothetical protein